MLKFVMLAVKYNLSAHLSNLPNLAAATCGMILNNVIYQIGMWGMIFAGKSQNDSLIVYFIALQALIWTAWGAINFFFGGWMDLGDLIVSGQFESKVATPRHPLVLVGVHSLHPSALGDLLMGIMGISYLFLSGEIAIGFRMIVASLLAFIALFSTYVFAGSIAFYVSRGNVLALMVREIVVSLCCYPVGKMFPSGLGRIFLLLTPAAAVSMLPMSWVESAGVEEFGRATFSVLIWLCLSLGFYNLGVKRFQAINSVGINS
jgi:ABC-type uncharacterized transport system permease subunit